jgi:predicted  nucleic acid-binding Zn-ribbon protein
MTVQSKTHNRATQSAARLRKVESLERLRDRVEAAADEIVRLRGENARMASDISELRSSLTEAREAPRLVFDEDPTELRAKVRSFIAAIDEYLQTEA